MTQPSNRSVRMTPPARSPASSTTRGAAARAAARRRPTGPAMPPPTITTSTMRSRRSRRAWRDARWCARTGRASARARPASTAGCPWPRLKMWPGRPPARSRTSSRLRSMRGRADRAAASGRGCPGCARSWPMRLPRLVERDAPVGADHVAAGLAHVGEHDRRAGAEVDRRHAPCRRRSKMRLRVRQRELAVVGGAERADPRVEHLHRVDAGLDLRDQVVADDVGEQRAEPVPGLGLAVHQRLGVARSCSSGRLRWRRTRA